MPPLPRGPCPARGTPSLLEGKMVLVFSSKWKASAAEGARQRAARQCEAAASTKTVAILSAGGAIVAIVAQGALYSVGSLHATHIPTDPGRQTVFCLFNSRKCLVVRRLLFSLPLPRWLRVCVPFGDWKAIE